jgi:hypothetical protein
MIEETEGVIRDLALSGESLQSARRVVILSRIEEWGEHVRLMTRGVSVCAFLANGGVGL